MALLAYNVRVLGYVPPILPRWYPAPSQDPYRWGGPLNRWPDGTTSSPDRPGGRPRKLPVPAKEEAIGPQWPHRGYVL